MKWNLSHRANAQREPQHYGPVQWNQRFNRVTRGLILVVAISFAGTGTAVADERSEFFEKRIRPILIEKCYKCHSVDKNQEGGLVLDSKQGWERGGDSGPAIVPGKLEESHLIQAVRWNGEVSRMPPEDGGGKLTESQIADLEKWVADGAYDPRNIDEKTSRAKTWDEKFAERSQWWSLQAPKWSEPPQKHAEISRGNFVDQFIFEKLAAAEIEPALVASPETLIRRAALVLTGLPPTPKEVEEFVAASQQDRDQAYQALVDRLLDSPQFGERFARHWLDVVRYTETHGNEWNYDVPYAWRYRDYVIRAFNQDLPYNQFVREQIAGDLLSEPRLSADGTMNESKIGTAFYRFGEVNHDSCVLFSVIGYDIVDNQVDTLTKAFQASTIACARCHEHKIDAFSTEDYHAILGILRSTRSVQPTLDGPETNRIPFEKLTELKKELKSELAQVWLEDIAKIDSDRLMKLLEEKKDQIKSWDDPLYLFSQISQSAEGFDAKWQEVVQALKKEQVERTEFNSKNFVGIVDFRNGELNGWYPDGLGLRSGGGKSGDFTIAHEGDNAVQYILPGGVFTFGLSNKMNGALRSPNLKRTHGKVSFEVIGGGFSLARLVFNNCQLNYTNQHSIHHPEWSWVTVDFQKDTDELHPYAELLTYWDNPKFPDPLGTLSKDTENQRQPYDTHAKNPRTWWGVRRVVAHDCAEVPKGNLDHLDRLVASDSVHDFSASVEQLKKLLVESVERFRDGVATDQDTVWLQWLLKHGLVENKRTRSSRLEEKIDSYRKIEIHELALPTTVAGMADEGTPIDQPLLNRGDHTKPGKPIERRFVEVLDRSKTPVGANGSGRAMLADRIASPENPLTARVYVNRVWHWVFGQGIVDTPDDFGHLGGTPSHPELLDDLAIDFVRNGWSTKKLIRNLVLSQAFQRSGTPSATAKELDPSNMMLSHYPVRRAEAEAIRDSLLQVAGRLDPKMYGPSIHPYRPTADSDKRLYEGPLDGNGRRSIYIKFQLMEPPHFMSAFNLPGGKITQGKRDKTNVPAQSLAMLNDPFVREMAKLWGEKIATRTDASKEERIIMMFREALGREPSKAELLRLAESVDQFAQVQQIPAGEVMNSPVIWKEVAHTIFNFKEFIYIP